MKKIYIALFFLFGISILMFAHPQVNTLINKSGSYYFSKADSLHGFDMIKYVITLTIDTQNRYIHGNVLATVQALEDMDYIEYELESLQVTNVLVNNQPASYSYQNGIIHIELNNVHNQDVFYTQVFYEGTPQLSNDVYHLGMFITDNYVMTLVDPSGCRWWWPAYDHPWDKAIVDLHITIRDDWLVASNGIRESIVDNNNGTKTHNWLGEYPMATYLVVITASNYQEINQNYNDLPIQNFVSPSQYQNALETLSNLPFMIQVFSQEYGEYPFEKYGNAVSPISTYGAMEHQTMTTLGNYIITGNHQYETTIAHELSHHWFGDCLTPLTWKDVWLSESFATYSEMIYTHHWQNWQAAVNYVRDNFHTYYLNWASSNGPHTIYNLPYAEYFTPPSYEKGASVLHMLRLKLGDETFFNILRTYYQRFKYGNVITQDFIDVCEEMSGENLEQFFNQWIFNPGTPEVDYTYFVNKNEQNPQLILYAKTISNTQNQFYLDIPIRINYESTSDSLIIYASYNQPQENLIEMTNNNFESLDIDPNYWILCRAYNKKKVANLVALAGNGQVTLYWDDFWNEIQIEGYNIYRAEEENGDYEKINQNPIDQNYFIDNIVSNNITYFYKVCAVKNQNFETDFSNITYATPIDFPMNQGILVIDETDNGNGTILHPTDNQVDEFYSSVINFPLTEYDYNEQGAPSLSYLANFSVVVWHDDDFSLSNFTNNTNLLASYINGGGNLIVSGWKTSQNVSINFFRNYFSDIQISQISDFVLTTAVSNDYQDLHIDSNKIPDNFNNELPFITLFDNTQNSIYVVSSQTQNSYDGRTCAIKKDFEDNLFVFLGFPLFYFNQSDVTEFFNQIFEEIEENYTSDNVIEYQNNFLIYPNPFVSLGNKLNIKISFTANRNHSGKICIYNLKGQLIKNIFYNAKKGKNIVSWNLRNSTNKIINSGIYIVKKDNKKVGKFVFIR